jgi:pyridoxine 5'-phosphate synthase PdxJ
LIDEVSIGHAIISESLQKGFKKTIIDYIKIING